MLASLLTTTELELHYPCSPDGVEKTRTRRSMVVWTLKEKGNVQGYPTRSTIHTNTPYKINGNHWITISNVASTTDSEVQIYDSGDAGQANGPRGGEFREVQVQLKGLTEPRSVVHARRQEAEGAREVVQTLWPCSV